MLVFFHFQVGNNAERFHQGPRMETLHIDFHSEIILHCWDGLNEGTCQNKKQNAQSTYRRNEFEKEKQRLVGPDHLSPVATGELKK